jgi:hypothetical protein
MIGTEECCHVRAVEAGTYVHTGIHVGMGAAAWIGPAAERKRITERRERTRPLLRTLACCITIGWKGKRL